MSSEPKQQESEQQRQEPLVHQLTPIHPDTQEPLDCAMTRPALIVDSTAAVFLGDNDMTGIMEPALSQAVVKIYWKNNKVFLFSQKDVLGAVVYNGSLLLPGTRHKVKEGDIVGLATDMASAKMLYAYKVELVNAETAAATSAAATQQQQAAATATTPAKLPPQVAEETMCAICMEIMVEPQTVVPCGHTFCKACLQHQQQSCASCRGPVRSQVPCRSLENLIGLFTSSKCREVSMIYEEGDLDSYYTRTNKTRTPLKARRRAVRQSSRRTAGASSSNNNVITIE